LKNKRDWGLKKGEPPNMSSEFEKRGERKKESNVRDKFSRKTGKG